MIRHHDDRLPVRRHLYRAGGDAVADDVPVAAMPERHLAREADALPIRVARDGRCLGKEAVNLLRVESIVLRAKHNADDHLVGGIVLQDTPAQLHLRKLCTWGTKADHIAAVEFSAVKSAEFLHGKCRTRAHDKRDVEPARKGDIGARTARGKTHREPIACTDRNCLIARGVGTIDLCQHIRARECDHRVCGECERRSHERRFERRLVTVIADQYVCNGEALRVHRSGRGDAVVLISSAPAVLHCGEGARDKYVNPHHRPPHARRPDSCQPPPPHGCGGTPPRRRGCSAPTHPHGRGRDQCECSRRSQSASIR